MPKADLQRRRDILMPRMLASEAQQGYGIARRNRDGTGDEPVVEDCALHVAQPGMEQRGRPSLARGVSENGR
jgi:hypothetical protein